MSSIVTIISSSLILIVSSAFIVIMVTGAIVSKVAEVMGRRELSRLIDYASIGLWICFGIGAIVALVIYIMS